MILDLMLLLIGSGYAFNHYYQKRKALRYTPDIDWYSVMSKSVPFRVQDFKIQDFKVQAGQITCSRILPGTITVARIADGILTRNEVRLQEQLC